MAPLIQKQLRLRNVKGADIIFRRPTTRESRRLNNYVLVLFQVEKTSPYAEFCFKGLTLVTINRRTWSFVSNFGDQTLRRVLFDFGDH